MKATLRHIYLGRTAYMSQRTCAVVKQIQSNQSSGRNALFKLILANKKERHPPLPTCTCCSRGSTTSIISVRFHHIRWKKNHQFNCRPEFTWISKLLEGIFSACVILVNYNKLFYELIHIHSPLAEFVALLQIIGLSFWNLFLKSNGKLARALSPVLWKCKRWPAYWINCTCVWSKR